MFPSRMKPGSDLPPDEPTPEPTINGTLSVLNMQDIMIPTEHLSRYTICASRIKAPWIQFGEASGSFVRFNTELGVVEWSEDMAGEPGARLILEKLREFAPEAFSDAELARTRRQVRELEQRLRDAEAVIARSGADWK